AFATPPRAPLVRVVPAAPSLAAEPAGRVFNSASLTAPLRAEGFLSAAARRDAGSAAATDGLSEQSVFGRGTEVGLPSASPPLEPAPIITAVRSSVLGDGAAFQCTTLHCNDAYPHRGRSVEAITAPGPPRPPPRRRRSRHHCARRPPPRES